MADYESVDGLARWNDLTFLLFRFSLSISLGTTGLGCPRLFNPIYTRLIAPFCWWSLHGFLKPMLSCLSPPFYLPTVSYTLRVLDDLCDLIDTIASVRCPSCLLFVLLS